MLGQHVVVAALALFGSVALAQEPARATLTLVVTDQSGAAIPNARVVATDEATGAHSEAKTDANGEASVAVDEAIYDLRAGAQGFEFWDEKKVAVKGETRKGVTLRFFSGSFSGSRVSVSPAIEIPLEHQPLAGEIASIPVELLPLPARRLHRRSRWF